MSLPSASDLKGKLIMYPAEFEKVMQLFFCIFIHIYTYLLN